MGGDRHGRLPGQPASLLSTRRSEARKPGDNPIQTAAATPSRLRTGAANRLGSHPPRDRDHHPFKASVKWAGFAVK